MVKTWKLAIVTPQGIFQGELTGEQEPGETDEQAMQGVSEVVRGYLTKQGVSNVLACIVTDGTIHIDAPNASLIPLDIEDEFTL